MAQFIFNSGESRVPGQEAAQKASYDVQGAKTPLGVGGTARADGKATLVPGADQAGRAGEAPSLFSDGSRKVDAGPDYTYSRIRLHKKDEVNIYAQQQDERLGMDKRIPPLIAMAVATIIVFFIGCTLPTQMFYNVTFLHTTPAELLDQFQSMVGGFFTFITGGDSLYASYAWETLAALLAGAALGLSGGVYQGAMKNALASPSTLGVTQGGALGIIIYGVFMYNGEYTGRMSGYSEWVSSLSTAEAISEVYGQFIGGMIGCFIVVAAICALAAVAGHGKISNVSLVIAGQVFASVIALVIQWIKYYLMQFSDNPELVQLLENAQSASFTGSYQASTMLVFAIPLIICMAGVFALSGKLSLLSFSDEEARSMGISTARVRYTMIALCTLLTALVVSYVGMIGFVGFMVPHIARRFIGPDFRYLLPACALLGALLVVAVHSISTLGLPGLEVGSTGLITSIIGCIAFLMTALRQRGNSSGQWL